MPGFYDLTRSGSSYAAYIPLPCQISIAGHDIDMNEIITVTETLTAEQAEKLATEAMLRYLREMEQDAIMWEVVAEIETRNDRLAGFID